MKYRAAMIIYEWFWIFTIAASPCISRTHSEQRNLNVSLKVGRSEKLIWSHFEEMVKTERNEKYKKHSVLTSAQVPQLQQQWAGGGEQAWTPSWQFGIWNIENWKLKEANLNTILCFALSAVTNDDSENVHDDEIDFENDDDDACLSGEAGVDHVGWKGLL